MTSVPRILIEVELGKKAVEKTDIFVYQDGRLVESHFADGRVHLQHLENPLAPQVAVAAAGRTSAPAIEGIALHVLGL